MIAIKLLKNKLTNNLELTTQQTKVLNKYRKKTGDETKKFEN